ncbi:C2 domain-containing protein At1g53590-like isoform X1 [Musa acuminata AAA Group]|uniref:C2 domain-containing protein At1g53590-like isoform X1 n=1 Tax=Musa acuminata AAA Group TaxID=214697 RepID=UPI0031D37BA6
MDITEVTIVHHIALVLLLLWVLVQLGKGHPVVFFVALLYLYKVNERYTLRLQKRLQFEERKFANQRRLLSDAESVRWLNHAIEKIWPVCMEQIASQQFLLPIIPWFLDKFKPWTARKAVMQHLYLGRNPPMFIDARVLRESSDDDHLVLELGMNFLSADDMSAKLAVQLRKRLGFGITANMHITGMHVEGKVLVGVKFLRQWPFIGRVRLCFAEPPYFQMTVKPIFGHGVDVTELPGISGWLDKLLDVAFGQTLVEPNMLVIDVEKFVLAPEEGWFTVNVKPPIGYAKLEMLEGADMKPSDFNGLSDPYVKGHLGPYRFQTKIQRKTLSPKWLEEFKIPISSWEGTNVLVLQVRDKDTIFDDILGNCSVNINDLRGGQRHDMWLSLQNVKMGRIHLAITVLEEELQKEQKDLSDEEIISKTTEPMTSRSDEKAEKLNTEVYHHHKMADEFEPINIKGQEKIGLWVHRPGSDVSQKWEPRKGRARYPDTRLHREDNGSTKSPSRSSSPRSRQSDSGSNEESADGKKPRLKIIKNGLHKLSSVFHRSPRKGSPRQCQEVVAPPPPPPNLWPIGEKRTSIKVIMPDGFDEKNGVPKLDEERCNSEISERESPGKGSSMLQTPKNFISKSSKSLKSVLSRKESDKLKEVQSPGAEDKDNSQGTNSSSDGLVDDPLVIGGLPISIAPCSHKVTVSAEDDKKDNI